MYALVNTFNKPHETFGVIESVHRTPEAAVRADERLQRAVKRANGTQSYMPTAIVELKRRLRVGDVIDQYYAVDAAANLSRATGRPDPEAAEIAEVF